MRRPLFIAGYVFFALLVSTLSPYLPLRPYRFELIALLVFYLGFSMPVSWGGPLVFWLGLIQESIGTSLHGLLATSYLASYLLLRLAKKNLFLEGFIFKVLWVFIFTFGQKAVEHFLLLHAGFGTPGIWIVLIQGALQSGLALLLFPLFDICLREPEDA